MHKALEEQAAFIQSPRDIGLAAESEHVLLVLTLSLGPKSFESRAPCIVLDGDSMYG